MTLPGVGVELEPLSVPLVPRDSVLELALELAQDLLGPLHRPVDAGHLFTVC